ncbi:MAG: FAD-binding domain-containing protein [Fluviicola sp.]
MITTNLEEILLLIDQIDPKNYAHTRNYGDGAVTKLSPYISRGVISTKMIYNHLVEKGYKLDEMEAFVKELAWRDYFQRVGQHHTNDLISSNLLQEDVQQDEISSAIVEARTGIQAIDKAITELYETGYMHNHMRMYVASISTNLVKSHWLSSAKWMYYNLIDADFASNACSWQWICQVRSKKRYYANQENVNRFFHSKQRATFIDTDTDNFHKIKIPNHFKEFKNLELKTELPVYKELIFDHKKSTAIYTIYNLDPNWRKEEDCNRVLILEPSHFEQFPVSSKTIDFIIQLNENLIGAQIFVGEFSDLQKITLSSNLYFKEHPLFIHFTGIKDERDWISTELTGDYPGFFNYWKKLEKELTRS